MSDGTYQDSDGGDVPYIPEGAAIVTAPNCGKGLYGAVTQMEADGELYTYAGTRVPLYTFTQRPPVRETTLTARPLFVPKQASPWSVALNVLE